MAALLTARICNGGSLEILEKNVKTLTRQMLGGAR